MSLGQNIRNYRKKKALTQEELAVRLGVSASAVNKWENEKSLPDIALLAPIARALDISPNTLLSFREQLPAEELDGIMREIDRRCKESSYAEAFRWTKKQLEQYPNCEPLILHAAICLDAFRTAQEVPDEAAYDEQISALYRCLLDSEDEGIRLNAADALVGFYRRRKQYDQAEQYVRYFSAQNPERKRRQAQIYADTGRTSEAYRAYEELLYTDYQRVNAEFHGMYLLAVQSGDLERARWLTDKQAALARCFEMGRYYEVSCRLELATLERDADAVIGTAREMLDSVQNIWSFCDSPLFEHMQFKQPDPAFVQEMRENLLQCFRDEETYGFLAHDRRWKELTGTT